MIADVQTNKVFFAEDIKEEFPDEFDSLQELIHRNGYQIGILEGTQDFYCRDFMPVQVSSNDYLQFDFKPTANLDEKEFQYISNPVMVALVNRLPTPRHSKIILEGGNVIKWMNKVIITDRVYKDNLHQFETKEAILKELEITLQCSVIIIPEYPNDKAGHADGLIRFIDEQRVFINETKDEPNKDWLEEFLQVIEDHNLETIELPRSVEENQDTAIGVYINYLEIGQLILVPQFNGYFYENVEAMKIIKENFPASYRIEPFQSDWIAKYGGVLNCAGWSVKN